MVTGDGYDEMVPLVGDSRIGERATCFALVAIGLAFALRPAVKPMAVPDPLPEPAAA